MDKWLALKVGLGSAAFLAAMGGAWLLSLPPASASKAVPPIPPDEVEATLSALKPPKRPRPLIAIIGINDATETTDYLMPTGILRRADIADVVALATESGPVTLFPVLTVEPDLTVANFDVRYPEGADYVIVPAMSRDDDPAALQWIRSQAAKGAIIIGVCAGAKVVAETGLLDGKRATTHWYYLDEMLGNHSTIRYVPDRRLVVDDDVITTTGISASMPMALTLIEAIAGRHKAESIAQDLGLTHWDARHDSNAFTFTRPFALTAMRNTLAFWKHETFGMELQPGVDEVALALIADAWSRTYRSRAVMFASTAGARPTRNGIRIVPDEITGSWPAQQRLPSVREPPARALDRALRSIATRYGRRTADFVAMQLEYPRGHRNKGATLPTGDPGIPLKHFQPS